MCVCVCDQRQNGIETLEVAFSEFETLFLRPAGPGAGRGRVLGWQITEDPSPTSRFGSLSLHPRGKETFTDRLPGLSSFPGAWTSVASVTGPSLPAGGSGLAPFPGPSRPQRHVFLGWSPHGGVCCPTARPMAGLGTEGTEGQAPPHLVASPALASEPVGWAVSEGPELG